MYLNKDKESSLSIYHNHNDSIKSEFTITKALAVWN